MNEDKKIIDIRISPPWSDLIMDGIKKVEMRKNKSDSWGRIKAGQILRVINEGTTEQNRSKNFLVKETRTYDNLLDCFCSEGVRNLLPGKNRIVEAEEVYLGFDGPSKEAIEARRKEFNYYGCIVIELTPYNKNKNNNKNRKNKKKASVDQIVDIQQFFMNIDPANVANMVSSSQVRMIKDIFSIEPRCGYINTKKDIKCTKHVTDNLGIINETTIRKETKDEYVTYTNKDGDIIYEYKKKTDVNYPYPEPNTDWPPSPNRNDIYNGICEVNFDDLYPSCMPRDNIC